MLRQGSLKLISSRSRWSVLAVATIACTAIPLAGLRGTIQEPDVPKASSGDMPKEKESENNSAGETKPKPLSKEFLAAYPPVEFKGSIVYRPGRFCAGGFGPEAAWLQERFAISALGKPMPGGVTIHGECIGDTPRADEERMHGGFGLSASFHEGDATVPGPLSKSADPLLGRKMRTVSTVELDGRKIAGFTHSSTFNEPEKWLIDDEHDYEKAAFAMVYDDCDQ